MPNVHRSGTKTYSFSFRQFISSLEGQREQKSENSGAKNIEPEMTSYQKKDMTIKTVKRIKLPFGDADSCGHSVDLQVGILWNCCRYSVCAIVSST